MARDEVEAPAELAIAALAAGGIALNLVAGLRPPLYAVLLLGGMPLVVNIARKLLKGELGSDMLAGLSIAVSAAMGQYLVGAILVLMLSGGQSLERLASKRASSALGALARRMPLIAHRRQGDRLDDVAIAEIEVGDSLVVLPYELCPVDGTVVDGRGVMDESYLTGEPYRISKAPGSRVLSGAVNGDSALTILALKPARDSRYASIMRVMEDAERHRPALRRLGDWLALWYAPAALALAAGAWLVAGDSQRFLAVLVVATPCPLLIAIPVAVIGAVSLAAARGIVVRNPSVLEEIAGCRTVILDKTGTLTFGKPALTDVLPAEDFTAAQTLRLAAALERYSRHPLAAALLSAAEGDGRTPPEVAEVRDAPGQGLSGRTGALELRLTSRGEVPAAERSKLPAPAEGLECVLLVNERLAAVFRFRDAPRPESAPFLTHLSPTHGVAKIMLVSGDRESEVRYLAAKVGIAEIAAQKSPEEKLAIVRAETLKASTLFVGDGINDAPALAAATVGVAIGIHSDVTAEAADAVIMTASIGKLDELIHIGARMRAVALQSAVGGMALSLVGMLAAATGHLPPIQGAIAQELIDLAAILNALRATLPPSRLTDY